jgi:hypothetical protein
VFLTNGTAGMPNWIEVLASAVGHRGRPLHQKPAEAESPPWQNEAVMSPLMRHRIRLITGVWLCWTIAGLFYIIQGMVPRLYRGGAVPWKYVFVGWMTGMYVCAALTPALLLQQAEPHHGCLPRSRRAGGKKLQGKRRHAVHVSPS